VGAGVDRSVDQPTVVPCVTLVHCFFVGGGNINDLFGFIQLAGLKSGQRFVYVWLGRLLPECHGWYQYYQNQQYTFHKFKYNGFKFSYFSTSAVSSAPSPG